MFLQRLEHAVSDASALQHQRVGIGEQRALHVAVAGARLPMRDARDLVLAEPHAARGLAMLRIDELAAARPARPQLAELAVFRVELAVRAAIELEARDRVVEDVGHEREDRPPVPRRAGLRAGLDYRVPLAEQI